MLRAVQHEIDQLSRLRTGDEAAFVMLVAQYQLPMLRLARSIVANEAVAEEVVQDTWIGVLRGIERFEGRSTFKTWLFTILVNRARSAGRRERPSMAPDATYTVDPSRFDSHGQWIDPVERWPDDIEDRLDAAAMAPILLSALEDLPPRQREVLLLRDVEGLSNDETCSALGISSGNQRILLHRGRSRLREILDTTMKRD